MVMTLVPKRTYELIEACTFTLHLENSTMNETVIKRLKVINSSVVYLEGLEPDTSYNITSFKAINHRGSSTSSESFAFETTGQGTMYMHICLHHCFKLHYRRGL